MKKVIFLLNLVLISFYNGQSNTITKTYTSKAEYGIKGNIKEVNTYICKVENNKIPADTINFSRKYVKTFDENGNSIEDNYLIKNEADIHKIKRIYSGQGKNMGYKQIYLIGNQKSIEEEYKYIWLDDFTYRDININEENFTQIVKLNKEFNLNETFLKQGAYECTEKIENITKNNKVERTKKIITTKTDDKTVVTYQVEVVKGYDKFDNPTIIYIYNTLDESQLKDIIIKKYIYY